MKRLYYWAPLPVAVAIWAWSATGSSDSLVPERQVHGVDEVSQDGAVDPDADSPPTPRRIPIERRRSEPLSALPVAVEEPEEEATERSEAPYADAAAEMEIRFNSDRERGAEAQSRERMLREAFSDPTQQGVHLQTVECRSSTCRVEVNFADQQTSAKTLRTLFLGPDTILPDGMGVTIPTRDTTDDGSIDATLYLFTSVPEPTDDEVAPSRDG